MSATITAIIPTFRRPQLLRRAIASALAQTYRDIKVCVYDNASNDETQSVVAGMIAADARLSYVCHEQHIDVIENFLFGMRRVNTPYFSFLSDDDVLFPGFYASAFASLAGQPDALFAAGSAIEFDEDGTVRYAPLAFWQREGRYSPPEGFTAMLGNRHATWTAVLFRQEAIDRVGLLDSLVGGPIDLDYELRIAARFPYVVFFEPSAGYVHHGLRVSAGEDSRVIDGYRRIMDKLTADAAIDPALRARIPALLERQMRQKLYEIAMKSIVAGNDQNARSAAASLRKEFASPVVAWGIETAASVSSRVPAIRSAIASVESWRLRRRAAATRRRLRASIAQDGSAYARFLQLR